MDIARVSRLSVRDFKSDFLKPQQPVIITDMVDSWIDGGHFSFAGLKSRYGQMEVDIETLDEDRAGDAAYYWDAIDSRRRTFGDYVDLVETEQVGSREYLAQYPLDRFDGLADHISPLPYYSQLITRITGNDPLLWVGPKGSVSALHFDPMHNFVVQLTGAKRWTIFPESEHRLLYIPSEAHPEFSPINIDDPDTVQYPRFSRASRTEFTLSAGEMLFLPMRWPHHVRAVSNAVNLNFWFTTWRDLFTRGPRYVARKAVRRVRSYFE